jgi:hypothetical protein
MKKHLAVILFGMVAVSIGVVSADTTSVTKKE